MWALASHAEIRKSMLLGLHPSQLPNKNGQHNDYRKYPARRGYCRCIECFRCERTCSVAIETACGRAWRGIGDYRDGSICLCTAMGAKISGAGGIRDIHCLHAESGRGVLAAPEDATGGSDLRGVVSDLVWRRGSDQCTARGIPVDSGAIAGSLA